MSSEHLPASPVTEPPVLACRPTADGVELDLQIGTDLAVLAGHFPDLPVVPGVCLLDWVVGFSPRYLGMLQEGTTRFRVKFRRVLQPDCIVTLVLRRTAGGRVEFEYRQADTVYSTGTVSSAGA